MKILVVLNPISGSRDKEEFMQYLVKSFRERNIGYELYKTSGDQDEQKISSLLDKYCPNRILSVGGDGTSSLCAKKLIDRDMPMGIVPFGSANGMAMELGINSDPVSALHDFMLSGYHKDLDMYKINNKYYGMHIGDIGLNARIVEGFSLDRERGMLTYAKHFLREFSQSELISYRIFVNGEKYEVQAYMVAFANARKYGTGVILNWKGNPYDGRIELVIAKELKIKTLLLAGMTTLNEEIGREAISEITSCEKAVIETEYPVSVQVDGEPVGKMQKVEVEVVPHAIKIILPHK